MTTIFSRMTLLLCFIVVFVFAGYAQTKDDSDKNKINTQQEETKKDRDCPESAIVRLRVSFDNSGKFEKAEIVLSGGCEFFDSQALEAAKKMKIEPPKRNGKKKSSSATVEYGFRKQ